MRTTEVHSVTVVISLSSIDEPILSFQRNAFLSLKEERKLLKKQKSEDLTNYRNAIDLLYHEVRCFANLVHTYFTVHASLVSRLSSTPLEVATPFLLRNSTLRQASNLQ